MNIRIRKKQIKRKLAAGHPISHNEMKFGIKHKMTDSVFHDPFVLASIHIREAGVQANKASETLKRLAMQTGQSVSYMASKIREGIIPTLTEVLNNDN